MSNVPVIAAHALGKSYRIWSSPGARLTVPMLEGIAGRLPAGPAGRLRTAAGRRYRDVWALRDVSFSVARGEALGIIGRNGSGKSTLLQIIAGTLQPTSGRAESIGRVAALLELGSGFNPEFTGRENVFLNATILGLSREETQARFAGIVAFADIGEFIDQPVKTYSSGMLMRLAFAVQTAVDPEVLIVDEALSVGDYFFQQKCFRRIADLRARGTTLLFVSHDLGSVRNLCQRALYLRRGRIEAIGDVQEVIARYHAEPESEPARPAAAPESASVTGNAAEVPTEAFWRGGQDTAGDAWLAVDFQDTHGRSRTRFRMTEQVRVVGHFRVHRAGRYRAALELKNRHDLLVNSTSCYTGGAEAVTLAAGAVCAFEVGMTLNFEAGQYSCQLVLADEAGRANRAARLATTPWLGPIEIVWDYENERAPFLGMFGPPVTVRFVPPSSR